MEQYTYFDIVKIRESLHLKLHVVKEDGRRYLVRIVFAREQAVSAECSCGLYGGSFYRYYTPMDNCVHVAAAMQVLSEYLSKNRFGDATD